MSAGINFPKKDIEVLRGEAGTLELSRRVEVWSVSWNWEKSVRERIKRGRLEFSRVEGNQLEEFTWLALVYLERNEGSREESRCWEWKNVWKYFNEAVSSRWKLLLHFVFVLFFYVKRLGKLVFGFLDVIAYSYFLVFLMFYFSFLMKNIYVISIALVMNMFG